MKNFKVFIAQSLDGFIARKNGEIDWLESLPNPTKEDHGYESFLKKIDTVAMGRKSYEKILSFGIDWPYPNCQTFVVSSNKNFKLNSPKTTVMSSLDKKNITQIKGAAKKDIWLLGGGILINSFIEEGLINELIVSVIPVILGEGIPLFPKASQTQLALKKATTFPTGVVNLTYSLS